MLRLTLMATWLAACVPPDAASTPTEVVDHAWTLVDERYALFLDKSVDWTAARDAATVGDEINDAALFEVLTDLLEELDDAHVNLVSWFETSWAPTYLQDEVPTYDEDLVHRGVLAFDFHQVGSLTYAVPDPTWAYLRVDDFTGIPGGSVLDRVFEELATADTLVLDLRGNGGGRLEQAQQLLARLVDAPSVAWHLQSSTGPAHDALSDPVATTVSPATVRFDGPLRVLVDGRTYSAANSIVYALGGRESVSGGQAPVVVVGQATSGGAGSPRWFELPNGWVMRFPTRRLTGPQQESIEAGYPPDVVVGPDPALVANGRDAMIEAALAR